MLPALRGGAMLKESAVGSQRVDEAIQQALKAAGDRKG
jgi:hypothetical protein